jgi:hypothetical protein
MSMAQNMFEALCPPQIWVTLKAPDCEEAHTRLLGLRIKPPVGRSIRATHSIDRYSPDDTVFLAVSKTIAALAQVQRKLKAEDLQTVLDEQIKAWVAPF